MEFLFKLFCFIVVVFIMYWIGWFVFAFGTSVYDTATGTDDGSELFWNVYLDEDTIN